MEIQAKSTLRVKTLDTSIRLAAGRLGKGFPEVGTPHDGGVGVLKREEKGNPGHEKETQRARRQTSSTLW